eukprot:gene17743-biopygen17355
MRFSLVPHAGGVLVGVEALHQLAGPRHRSCARVLLPICCRPSSLLPCPLWCHNVQPGVCEALCRRCPRRGARRGVGPML